MQSYYRDCYIITRLAFIRLFGYQHQHTGTHTCSMLSVVPCSVENNKRQPQPHLTRLHRMLRYFLSNPFACFNISFRQRAHMLEYFTQRARMLQYCIQRARILQHFIQPARTHASILYSTRTHAVIFYSARTRVRIV